MNLVSQKFIEKSGSFCFIIFLALYRALNNIYK